MAKLLQKGRSNNLFQRWKRPLDIHSSSSQYHPYFSSSSVRTNPLHTLQPPASLFHSSRKITKERLPAGSLVGDYMKVAGERIAQSNWIQVDGIPPTSSLEAMVEGIQTALEKESKRGIVDLDAPWDPSEPVPSLLLDSNTWIQKAHLNLSTLARPTGWFIQLENRSLVHAILQHDGGLVCAWKKVAVTEHRDPKRPYYNVSDATIRVENCPLKTSHMNVMNLFSRYDLKAGPGAVEEWKGGREGRPMTFLVHFADASWARSAIREKQGQFIDDNKLLLAPFPRQIV